ncbi:MAG: hypothetical protein ACI9TH_004528 [Kiritimatiellia bacterium]|jgi:hypothetical protein
MAAAFYIAIENPPEGFEYQVDGQALSRADQTLIPICQELGLAPLMDFFSQDPKELAEMLESLEPDDMELPAEQWFDAAAGLQVIQGLIAHFKQQSSKAPKGIVSELKTFLPVLQNAKDLGLRWHLAIDF